MDMQKYKIRTSLLIVVLLSLTTFVTGCAPNPSKPIVINQNNNVEKILHNTPAPIGKYEAPARWDETIGTISDRVSISIQADIMVNNVEKYPVVKIAPDDITQEEANRIIQTFANGQTLYIPRKESEYTKSEIAEMILLLKQDISDSNSDLNKIKNTDPLGYEMSLMSVKNQIAYLENLYKTAPDEYERKISDGIFQTPSMDNDFSVPGTNMNEVLSALLDTKVINVEMDLGKEKPSSLIILKNSSNKSNFVSFTNFMHPQRSARVFNEAKDLANQNMTLADAEKAAENVLKKLGIDYMQLSVRASCPYTVDPVDFSIPLEDLPRYYVFYFTRSVNGIPVTYVDNRMLLTGSNDTPYAEQWPEEVAVLRMDNTGVLKFQWQSPTRLISTISENVSLLPFDEIKAIFNKQITVQNAWLENQGFDKYCLYITKITLGYARIPIKDSLNEYLLVPAWDFFGYNTTQMAGEKDPFVEDNFCQSYLTINAIDGSIIKRDVSGYIVN